MSIDTIAKLLSAGGGGSDSGTYTADTIARRRKIADEYLGMGKQKKITHWAEGLAQMGEAALGGYMHNKLDQEAKANESAQTAAIVSLLNGGDGSSLPQSAPQAEAPAPAQSGAINDDPTAGGVMAGGYGKNIVPTDNGDSVVLPPRNPLGGLNPEFRTKFADLRTAAADKGVNFDAPEAGTIGNVRTPEQQAALYAQGRTAPGPVVTGTLNSNHIAGNAMDVVPRNGATPSQVGSVVSALMKTDPRFTGMRSGATFSNLNDPLHVELNKPQGVQVASNDPAIGIPQSMQGGPSAMPTIPPQDGGNVASLPPGGVPSGNGPMAAPSQGGPETRVKVAQALANGPAAGPASSDMRGRISQMLQSPNPQARALGKQLAVGYIQKQFTEASPTNDMKELNAINAERKARGESPMGLYDYQRSLKEAGKPITNINQQQESEYQKATGKHFADLNNTIATGALKARGEVATLNRLGSLLADPNIYQGAGGGTVLEAKRLAKAVGIDVGDLGGAEAVRAIQNQYALELRNPAGGAGMPGAMSDKDREFLQSIPPGLERTREGNILIGDYRRKIAQRAIDVDRQRQQYVKKNGRLDEGFYQALADYSDANPLFSEADAAKLGGGNAGAPAPSGAPRQRATNPTTGETIEFDGRAWVPVK